MALMEGLGMVKCGLCLLAALQLVYGGNTTDWDKVGVSMQNYYIRYTIDAAQGFPATNISHMRVGFTTRKKQGILMQIGDATNTKYVTMNINNNGGVNLFISVDPQDGWEMNTNIMYDVTDGQPHVVTMRRDGPGGHVVHLQVDDQPETSADTGSLFGDKILDSPQYVFIGNNDTTLSSNRFEGCIYGIQLDGTNLLQLAFQNPQPAFVETFPQTTLQQVTCGLDETTTSIPSTTNTSLITASTTQAGGAPVTTTHSPIDGAARHVSVAALLAATVAACVFII